MASAMAVTIFRFAPDNLIAAGYDASAAVSYAHTYWQSYNPNYTDCNPLGGDCANFVSQSLYAGGIPQDGTWKPGSSAWQYCPSMVAYFSERYRVIDYADADDIKVGNPVFYWNTSSNRWSHAAICTGFSGNTPLVTAHNKDRLDVDWRLGGAQYWGTERRMTVLINESDSPAPDIHTPVGCLDFATSFEPGTVTVQGWVFDHDDINAALGVHIYIDGPAGSGTCISGDIVANLDSSDVNETFGITGKHRFRATIRVPDEFTGVHEIYAHAIDVGGTNNICFGHDTADITAWSNSHDPVGCLDYATCYDPGTITLKGWVFDEDDIQQAMTVHVYIDGPAGTGVCINSTVVADQESNDVSKAYGITGRHRFLVTIPVPKEFTGIHEIYVHAIDINGTNNVCFGHDTADITVAESTSGIIKSVKVENESASGYTVLITADETKVSSIAVPVWTQKEGQTDAQAQDDLNAAWQTKCVASKIGKNLYRYHVLASDHKNESGKYCSDVYVFNAKGEVADRWCIETGHRTYANLPASVIKKVTYDKVSSSGYTLTITVADAAKVGFIAVPVWSVENGQTDAQAQDDLIADWTVKCRAKSAGNNTFTYTVETADHGNAYGKYCNDVYAYTSSGALLDRWCIETNHRTYVNVPVPKYSISLDANSGTVSSASKEVTYSSTYGTLPTPTRKGYTFSGWYTAKTGGTKITASTIVNMTAKHTIYAQWSPATYTVTLDANGGTVSAETVKVKMDTAYGTLPDPKRGGFTFDGWYTAKTGGSKVTSATKFTAAANQTLYAHWIQVAGDANNDGKATVTDAVLLQRWLLTDPNVTLANWLAADMNEDGRLNAVDLTLLKQLLMKKSSK